MKAFLFIIPLFLLTNCGGGSYYNFPNKEEKANINLSKYKANIRDFDLTLFETKISSRRPIGEDEKSEFLNTGQMKQLMTDTVETLLQQNSYLADDKNPKKQEAYQYDIKITASRNFHFLTKKYIGLSVEGFQINVYKDEKLLATKNLEGSKSGLIVTGRVINCGHNRGFIKNLETVGQSFTGMGKSKEKEVEDVKYCGIALYNSVIALDKNL